MAIAEKFVSVDISKLLSRLTNLCKEYYGERLITLAVFGSVGRGTSRPDSDVDLLFIVKNLPFGRMARVEEFSVIESLLKQEVKEQFELSPIFKTPEEISKGSPLFLDMTEDVRMLFDKEDYFKNILKNLQARLQNLGAQRIWQGNVWYWDLKPNYKQGEIFEI